MVETTPIDPKEVAAICKKITGKYGLNECRVCAKALAKALDAKGVPRKIVRLKIEGASSGFIVMKNENFPIPFETAPEGAISETGVHFGVKILDLEKTFCTVFRKGIKASDWRKQFDCDNHQFRVMELDDL